MARDPADRSITRLESNRYATKCEGQIAMIRRADTLHEVSRLAVVPLPYALSGDYAARDAQTSVRTAAEERARELITNQINNFVRAEPVARDKLKRVVIDNMALMTGPLAHLRSWTNSKLIAAEQMVKI